jgi:RNA polymerase sigma-70 factor (ECF subfamily)
VSKTLSDEELMQQLQGGNQLALNELYDRHSKKVWTFISKRVSREHAEDLFQDCFIKIVEKKDSWNKQPFVLWLYVVLRNLVIDFHRAQTRGGRIMRLMKPLADDHSMNSIDFNDLVEGVAPETQKLLSDFFKEGFSYKELSQEYETSEMSLRKRVSRALALLKTGERNE